MIDEVAVGDGELLRQRLNVTGAEETLRSVIEALGEEVAENHEGEGRDDR